MPSVSRVPTLGTVCLVVLVQIHIISPVQRTPPSPASTDAPAYCGCVAAFLGNAAGAHDVATDSLVLLLAASVGTPVHCKRAAVRRGNRLPAVTVTSRPSRSASDLRRPPTRLPIMDAPPRSAAQSNTALSCRRRPCRGRHTLPHPRGVRRDARPSRSCRRSAAPSKAGISLWRSPWRALRA